MDSALRHEWLDREIANEGGRQSSIKRGIILSLPAIAATFLFLADNLVNISGLSINLLKLILISALSVYLFIHGVFMAIGYIFDFTDVNLGNITGLRPAYWIVLMESFYLILINDSSIYVYINDPIKIYLNIVMAVSICIGIISIIFFRVMSKRYRSSNEIFSKSIKDAKILAIKTKVKAIKFGGLFGALVVISPLLIAVITPVSFVASIYEDDTINKIEKINIILACLSSASLLALIQFFLYQFDRYNVRLISLLRGLKLADMDLIAEFGSSELSLDRIIPNLFRNIDSTHDLIYSVNTLLGHPRKSTIDVARFSFYLLGNKSDNYKEIQSLMHEELLGD